MSALRLRLGVSAGVLLAAAGVVAGALSDPYFCVPAGVATGALVALLFAGRSRRTWVARVTTVAAVVSLVATALAPGADAAQAVQFFGLLELASLIWLIILVVRLAPTRAATLVGALTSLAQATLILRATRDLPPIDQIGAVGFWAIGAACAVAGGSYLRSLDNTRVRAVRDARRAQRLSLARDLHDFVAHDVSGIVVQAQAARHVAAQDPQAVLDALRRIEDAGLQALASMDRTVHMLHDLEGDQPVAAEVNGTDGPGSDGASGAGAMPAGAGTDAAERTPARGIGDLPELLERFGAGGGGAVRLDLPDGLAAAVPRELHPTVYRVVVEALTNVRRHAPGHSSVLVSLRRERQDGKHVLTVAVANDVGDPDGAGRHDDSAGEPALGRPDGAARHSGLGLVGLAERVGALGGRLTAGPDGRAGWRTAVDLPLPEEPEGLTR
ncbi:sensor histidine kinase [Actinopolymorpha pittospori]|uniref:histidine kinase n=1 Tax=Actinopolymorpha pittospori TaxID=648752 RepID=A0A927NBV2_9ACTN|nr:histidine kinase [Actinopolymorpha pittospori]MBE1611950.1 signal transduction histidine kinase [Actinopolymorpha pittospori]